MWDIDNFPGADHVPWQLLIRARLVRELDAVIASTVAHRVGAVASSKGAHAVALAAQEAVAGGNREPATAEQRVSAFEAVLDYDELCPPYWPHHWPPRPHRFDDLSDPITEVVVAQSLELVRRAGSEDLQKSLGSALAELSTARG
jgi:hypothetical protein